EAYVKAHGRGMNALPFRSFAFRLSPSHQAALALHHALAPPRRAHQAWAIDLTHRSSPAPPLLACDQPAPGASPAAHSLPHASSHEMLACDADVAQPESAMWRSMLVQLSPAHVLAVSLGCQRLPRHHALRLHAWNTVPLLRDDPVTDILGLGISL
ncbi:unnamed protein product, partial [Closterium sp. Naga37s-1]